MSRYTFRASRQRKSPALLEWLGWGDILEAESGSLHLVIPSNRSQLARVLSNLFAAPVAAIALFGYLSIVEALPSFEGVVRTFFALGNLIAAIIVMVLGCAATFLLVELVALPVQARHPQRVVGLEVKDVRFGRFYHTLKVIAEDKELILMVAGRSRKLKTGFEQTAKAKENRVK